MILDILLCYFIVLSLSGVVYYLIHEFRSIYIRNDRQLHNYTVAEVLLSIFFLPIELTVILFTAPNLGLGKLLGKRPFRKQILKVGDKVFYGGKTREVLEVRFDAPDFE